MALVDGQDNPGQTRGRIAAEVETFAETPWYRDIRVIRALAQAAFALVVIAATAGIIANLLHNLKTSNIPLNFGIFSGPFSVSLPEGPDITQDWTWIQNTDTVIAVTAGIYSVLFAALLFLLWKNRVGLRMTLSGTANTALGIARVVNTRADGTPHVNIALLIHEEKQVPHVHRPHEAEANPIGAVMLVGVLILLTLFVLAFPPERIPDELARYFFPRSISRAFFTGIANTLRVVVFSLIACTVVGVFVGIGLLSRNFIVRSISVVYVEIFRNTPLPVQLLFIYRLLTLILPRPVDSITTSSALKFIPPGQELYALNAQGIYIANANPSDKFGLFFIIMLVAFLVTAFIRHRRLTYQEKSGRPAEIYRYTLPLWLGAFVLAWIVTGGWPLGGTGPFTASYPMLAGRRVEGGAEFSLAFFSLFVGLTLYTGAFIAEIVRAGIQSVPYGQIEAARSQGLNGGQVLQLVVLPQALRLIIPPLGNQYVNLGKNSSLGIIVTYVDLYRVANLANNESGQAVPFFAGLTVTYLALSLMLSVMTNFVNRSTKIRTR